MKSKEYTEKLLLETTDIAKGLKTLIDSTCNFRGIKVDNGDILRTKSKHMLVLIIGQVRSLEDILEVPPNEALYPDLEYQIL